MTNDSNLFRALEKSILGYPMAFAQDFALPDNGYPFYDITQDDNNINIVLAMALAGWSKSEISVDVKETEIVVTGTENEKPTEELGYHYVHRGISYKDFKKVFKINTDVVVDGASLEDGLLTVKLHREIPEAKKPRTLEL